MVYSSHFFVAAQQKAQPCGSATNKDRKKMHLQITSLLSHCKNLTKIVIFFLAFSNSAIVVAFVDELTVVVVVVDWVGIGGLRTLGSNTRRLGAMSDLSKLEFLLAFSALRVRRLWFSSDFFNSPLIARSFSNYNQSVFWTKILCNFFL